MRHRLNASTIVLGIMTVFMLVPSASAQTCTPTGFIRDGIDMTAALINPASVPTPLDATGCNIGVYYDHTIAGGVATLNQVDIGGANYFGVVVNADAGPLTANLTRNFIHNIGEVPFNGAQHGLGIYVRAFGTFNLTGTIVGNIVYAYQKGGIVVNGAGAKISRLDNNQVYGLGHVNFIAQNGIQIAYGAMPWPSSVLGNVVTGNSYIGFPGDGSASGGILIVGGPGYGLCPNGDPCPYTKNVLIGINPALTAVTANILLNNDVGVFVSNVAADGVSPPPTPTNNLIVGSFAGSDQHYNTSYEAGISDFGNADYILGNYVLQGGGYTTCHTSIDTVGSIATVVALNTPPGCTGLNSAAASASRLKAAPEKP